MGGGRVASDTCNRDLLASRGAYIKKGSSRDYGGLALHKRSQIRFIKPDEAYFAQTKMKRALKQWSSRAKRRRRDVAIKRGVKNSGNVYAALARRRLKNFNANEVARALLRRARRRTRV